jgi:hypothetical protein
VVFAEYAAAAGEGVLIQFSCCLGFAGCAEDDCEVAGGLQGVGVVFAEYAAAAGEGIFAEFSCCLGFAGCRPR